MYMPFQFGIHIPLSKSQINHVDFSLVLTANAKVIRLDSPVNI